MEELEKEVKKLKKELFDLEKVFFHEKDLLIKVINSLALAASRCPGLSQELEALQGLLDPKEQLDIDAIEARLNSLKGKLLAAEVEAISPEDIAAIKQTKETLVSACRGLRRIMVAVTEDLYPLDTALDQKASQVDIDCTKDLRKEDFEQASKGLLSFVAE